MGHTWRELQLALSEVRKHELLLPEEGEVEFREVQLLQGHDSIGSGVVSWPSKNHGRAVPHPVKGGGERSSALLHPFTSRQGSKRCMRLTIPWLLLSTRFTPR